MTKEIINFPEPFKFTPYKKCTFSFAPRKQCTTFSQDYFLKVCKVIILGDQCVGKTSLLNRFCHKMFDSKYKTTIGVDFQMEEINIMGIPYHMQIWDTAGQERFKCITRCYYRKAHVIILVFDLSVVKTLANCQNWLRDALDVCTSPGRRPFIFLVGSKKDLLSKEVYKNVESLALQDAKKLGAEFWSVSSKTGENIDSLFFRAAALSFDDALCLSMSPSTSEVKIQREIHIGNELISFKNHLKKKEIHGCCIGNHLYTQVRSGYW